MELVLERRETSDVLQEMSAEEAAVIMHEQIHYEELLLTDRGGRVLRIEWNSSDVQTVIKEPGKHCH